MNEKELIRERLHRNGLNAPFNSITDCVYALSGIQSQFQQFAEVSILNRCKKAPKLQEFQKLYEDHGIINLWGQRHTLHMYTPEDWNLICDIYHDAFFPKAYQERFLQDFEQMMAKIEHDSFEEGYINKSRILEILVNQLGHEQLENDYIDYMLIRHCCAMGLMFGVPAKPSIKQFGSYSAIKSPRWAFDGDALKALEDIMKRYFKSYGPATLQDFCHWSGLSLGLAKTVFLRVEHELGVKTLNDRTYYTFGEAEPAASNKLYLLGKFDPLFVSYKHKDWIVTRAQELEIWKSAARVEAVVLDGTNVIGTWRHSLKGNKMSINICPMANISAACDKRIKSKAEKLALFWKKELDAITYA
ncbi:winged helix DNA-binding domain-containing protein [Eubacteriales bacterium OttesenSCG-928-K08]|nr:winged helix DNA-binding domain-containing protein [Eubacteriales bacterium OttesenSCG-928-K08]